MNNTIVTKLVSTIIPVYNRPDLLVEAVESILSQTYRPIEVVIIDDGSTDNTPGIIASLVRKYSEVVATRQKNGGPGVARETGRQMARGEFIQYLDSDDLLLPNKFQAQVKALRKDESSGIAYGKTHHSGLGDELKPVAFKRTGEKLSYLFPSLLESRWWSTSTPLYRRSVTDLIGPWSDLWNEEDWEYESRAAMHNIKLVYCDEFVSVTRWHDDRLYMGGSTDPGKLSNRAKAQELIYQHVQEAKVSPDIPEFLHYLKAIFLLSRQCGAVGLISDSKRLFELANEGFNQAEIRNLQASLYRAGALFAGWKNMGRFSLWVDSLRSGGRE